MFILHNTQAYLKKLKSYLQIIQCEYMWLCLKYKSSQIILRLIY